LIARPGDEAGAAFVEAIGAELGDGARPELFAPASELSQRYRSAGRAPNLRGLDAAELHAYLATRVPATFAATRRVLGEIATVKADWAPRSLLDLGSGPGTATWAAADVFTSLDSALLVESDPGMATIAARLAEGGLSRFVGELDWARGDAACLELPPSDLVVAGYVLGELGHEREEPALRSWWHATLGELVIVEPGTPAGFERLRVARDNLISWGAHVTAPCPHDGRCPMEGSDWCHFAVRLERSALHRDLKAAKLGYEDEKYSYLVVSPDRSSSPAARLVRSPRPHKGHVRLVVCEPAGLNERVVSRRDKDIYRQAREARWGDRLQLDR